MTLKTWTRGGSITELKGRQGRRIAGESKFLFSEQALRLRARRAARRTATRAGADGSATANWASAAGARVATERRSGATRRRPPPAARRGPKSGAPRARAASRPPIALGRRLGFVCLARRARRLRAVGDAPGRADSSRRRPTRSRCSAPPCSPTRSHADPRLALAPDLLHNGVPHHAHRRVRALRRRLRRQQRAAGARRRAAADLPAQPALGRAQADVLGSVLAERVLDAVALALLLVLLSVGRVAGSSPRRHAAAGRPSPCWWGPRRDRRGAWRCAAASDFEPSPSTVRPLVARVAHLASWGGSVLLLVTTGVWIIEG